MNDRRRRDWGELFIVGLVGVGIGESIGRYGWRGTFWSAVTLAALGVGAWLWVHALVAPWRIWRRLRDGQWPSVDGGYPSDEAD